MARLTSATARFSWVAAGMLAAASVAAAGCSSSPATGAPQASGASIPPVRVLAAQHAPASWRKASLLSGRAVLAYPPAMHRVEGDRGTVSAAKTGSPAA